jgi:hypothetical protein
MALLIVAGAGTLIALTAGGPGGPPPALAAFLSLLLILSGVVFSTLTVRVDDEVVELRFGLDRDGEMRTLQGIGDALKLSRERIRQIESRAKEKLRRSKRAKELRSYLN